MNKRKWQILAIILALGVTMAIALQSCGKDKSANVTTFYGAGS